MNRIAEEGDKACQAGVPKSKNPYRAPLAQKAAIARIEQFLQGFTLPFVERVLRMAGPEVGFLQRIVDMGSGFFASGVKLPDKPEQPRCNVQRAGLRLIQGIIQISSITRA